MYQSQSYHTANYRGNQPGHDAYLRSDSQNPSGLAGTQNVTSQYRGLQTSTFQPSGFVSSAYGQNVGTTSIPTGQYGQTGQYPSSQQYHTANYRGNQPGHDNYLRADSTQPAQQQFGIGAQGFAGNVGGNIGQGFAGNVGISGTGVSYQAGQIGQYGQTGQYPSSQQYHTANYRGDQPGHDNYLRADSTQPAQQQYGIGLQGVSGNVGGGYGGVTGTAGGNIGGIGRSFRSGFGGVPGSSIGNIGAGAVSSFAGQTTIPSSQSYHTANYRGNQPGHDNDLRADSTQPAQQQFGIGMQNVSGVTGSGFGTGSGLLGR